MENIGYWILDIGLDGIFVLNNCMLIFYSFDVTKMTNTKFLGGAAHRTPGYGPVLQV